MARNARRERIEFDASEPRARGHLLRHQAEEVPDAKRRLQHTPAREAEPLDGFVNAADDRGRRVVRVERRSSRRLVLLRREQCLQPVALGLPFLRAEVGEDLRDATPADIFDQRAPFLIRCLPAFPVELLRPTRWPQSYRVPSA